MATRADNASKDGPKKPTVSPGSLQKKAINVRSSKPLLHWFQRKLAGTVKGKAAGKGRTSSPIPLRATNRVVSAPAASSAQHRPAISLNGDSLSSNHSNDDLGSSCDHSSGARDSMWSPTSALEADEDASMRPIPPSSPPSPSPSRSSSSYLSNPRTFRSIAASTKPTTLLSIDLHGNGMAHIAQAPITPNSHRFNHGRSPSTSSANALSTSASVTFSALPPSPEPNSDTTVSSTVQAPLHTQHHPRNNPRPSSPPLDNASVLTLASSAYAHPGLRPGAITPGWGSSPPSAVGADSYSQYGGSYAESIRLGDDGLDERDVDASVRALRPRSSRRGSWESEVSRWSARIQVGTPSLARDRSLWTTNSVRTGGFSSENMEVYDNDDTEVEGAVSPHEPTPTTAALVPPVIIARHCSVETVADQKSVDGLIKPENIPLPQDTDNDLASPDSLSVPAR